MTSAVARRTWPGSSAHRPSGRWPCSKGPAPQLSPCPRAARLCAARPLDEACRPGRASTRRWSPLDAAGRDSSRSATTSERRRRDAIGQLDIRRTERPQHVVQANRAGGAARDVPRDVAVDLGDQAARLQAVTMRSMLSGDRPNSSTRSRLLTPPAAFARAGHDRQQLRRDETVHRLVTVLPPLLGLEQAQVLHGEAISTPSSTSSQET